MISKVIKSAINQFKPPLKFIIFIFLCIASLITVYPILAIVFIPILIYREVVKVIVQTQNPKCGPIISGIDAVLADKDPYKNPLIILAPYWVLTSKLDKNQIVKTLNEQILKPNIYPELKQKIIKKFGYYFWHPIENFDVEKHVKYLNPDNPEEPITRKQLRLIAAEKIVSLPFDSKLSPWEIILIPNFDDPEYPSAKSALFIRANHCLMDGYSLVNFTRRLALKPWTIKVGQAFIQKKRIGFRESLSVLQTTLKLLLTGPYVAVKMTQFSNDDSEFLKRALSPVQENKVVARLTETRKIEGKRLKKLRAKYNVSASSLLLTLSLESAMRFLKQKCNEGFAQVPRSIYLHMPFPLPAHPDAMTNYWSQVRMPIKVHKTDDAFRTLKYIHKQYEYFRTSAVPPVMYCITYMLGFLPAYLFPKMNKIFVQTMMLTCIPGPAEAADMCGYEWEGCGLAGTPVTGSAFVVAIQNYLGKFWIDTGGVGSLFQSQLDLTQVEDYVFEVLEELETDGRAIKNNN